MKVNIRIKAELAMVRSFSNCIMNGHFECYYRSRSSACVRTIEILAYGFDQLKGKQGRELPYLFKIQPLEKWAFVVYTVLVNIFFAYFLFFAIRHRYVAGCMERASRQQQAASINLRL